jgi:hypothetical protein
MLTIAHKQPGEDTARSNLSSALVIPDDSLGIEMVQLRSQKWIFVNGPH